MRVILVILSFLFLSGCNSPSPVGKRLAAIESRIQENPDSCYEALGAMESPEQLSSSERALYALLFSQAKDKVYDYTDNDSLIRIAVDYYSSQKDPKRYMLSQYYWGRVQYHAKEYSLGLVSFFKALEAAGKLQDNYWQSLCCRGIADIYGETGDGHEDVDYSKKEYDYIRLTGKQPYINYAINDLAEAHFSVEDYDKTIGLSTQLLDSAEKYDDSYLYVLCHRNIGLSQIAEKNDSSAYYHFEKVCNTDYAQTLDSIYLAIAMTGVGMTSEAKEMLRHFPEDQKMVYLLKYNLALKNEDPVDALNNLRKLNRLNNEYNWERIRMNINSDLLGYYESQRVIDGIRSEKLKAVIIAVVAIVVLVLTVFIAIAVFYRKRSKARIERSLAYAEQLRDDLRRMELSQNQAYDEIKIKESTYNSTIVEYRRRLGQLTEKYHEAKAQVNLSLTKESDMLEEIEILRKRIESVENDYKEIKSLYKDSSMAIRDLFSSKYELLDKFSRMAYEAPDTASANKKIARMATEMLETISSDSDKMKKMEDYVNMHYGGIVSKLRDDVPKLSDTDIRIFVFHCLGFSMNSIALFLKVDKVTSVYDRKKRLKKKIRSIGEERASIYLDFL